MCVYIYIYMCTEHKHILLLKSGACHSRSVLEHVLVFCGLAGFRFPVFRAIQDSLQSFPLAPASLPFSDNNFHSILIRAGSDVCHKSHTQSFVQNLLFDVPGLEHMGLGKNSRRLHDCTRRYVDYCRTGEYRGLENHRKIRRV